MEAEKNTKYVIVWLVLALVFTVGVGCFNLPAFYKLSTLGVLGSATVTEVTPEYHNTLRYQYQVGGGTYQGRMQTWTPNPGLDQIKVGQQVVIYYDPKNPGLSVPGDPKRMLKNEILSVALVGLVFPSLIVGVWIHKSRQ